MTTGIIESGWLRLSTNLLLASCLRLVLIFYGLIQDHLMLVKYTDIDYIVFTDGARFISEGRSPYLRSTYRYTPLLAWLLQPNVFLSPIFGKLLFSLFDISAGYIIYHLVSKATKKHTTSLHCAQLWLFNPVTLAVSTRGNAESLMAVLVLGMLLVVERRGLICLVLAGLLYGVAVHVKIYPITYVLVIYLFVNGRKVENTTGISNWNLKIRFVLPGRDVIVFGLAALVAFCGLTTIFYVQYGDAFLHETYFYHLTRRDIRHNFSPYFYLLYLLSGSGAEDAMLFSLAMFLPQVILMVATAARYHSHLEFACFLQTFVFVTFNKVCTSQYFLWYLCLLPLVVPHLAMDLKTAGALCALWLMGQGVWLFPAYLLEFHCYNSFLYIWLAGIFFFTINSYILYSFIDRFRPKTE